MIRSIQSKNLLKIIFSLGVSIDILIKYCKWEILGRVPLLSMGVKHRTRLDYWKRCCSSTTNTEFGWGLKYETNHDKKVLSWPIRALLLVIYDHFTFEYGKSFNMITSYCNWFTLSVEISYLTSVFSDRIGFSFSPIRNLYVMRSAIWYHLHNLKNVKNTHEGVFLVKLQALNETLLHGCFSRFLNLTNGNKSYKASHFAQFTETY